uniref:Uncharacterized protein n=1 Tax=Arundo donax TaxID=35708 RepID=A0A0A9F3B8_ARUDO
MYAGSRKSSSIAFSCCFPLRIFEIGNGLHRCRLEILHKRCSIFVFLLQCSIFVGGYVL